MLKEKVDEAVTSPDRRRKQQVAFVLPEVGIHETPWLKREPFPVDRLRDGIGELMTQKTCRIHRIAEALLEELVVRLVNGVVGHDRLRLPFRDILNLTPGRAENATAG